MYNTSTYEISTGIKNYIDDLNTKFENSLFTDIDGYTANHLGLARLDINGIPMANDSGAEYYDCLMDDNYSLVTSFIESADRKYVGDGYEASVDLLVSVNVSKFTGYTEEGIIEAVSNIVKLSSFNFKTLSRDAAALKGIVNEVSDSMYPFFVFRIKTKLII